MKCGKCGSEIPSKSKFCLSCGAAVEQVEALVESGSQESRKAKVRSLGIIAGLLLVVGIAYAITRGTGGDRVLDAVRPGTPQQTSVVVASPLADNGSDVLKASKVETKDTTAPADILAYLEHIRKIEDQRKNMRTDLSPAFDMLKKAYNIQYDAEDEAREKDKKDISGGIDSYTDKWQKIVSSFNEVKAPAGCDKLASAYGDALGRYSETMIKIQVALDKGDASALYAMYGNAQSDVDTALAKADEALSTTCKSYGIDKNFSIDTDKGVGSLLVPELPSK